MGIFSTNSMTLQHADGTVLATGKPCQLDPVNLPWMMEGQGMIPVDSYDLYTIGWTTPAPIRGDYFVDEATGTKYSVFSTIFTTQTSLQLRVTKYSGVTP